MTNKYSEGYPGARYYGGTQFVDKIETLAQERARIAFGNLDAEKWGVNVQPFSGSPANMAIYTALMNPGDKMMGLALAEGGHLTHGFETPTKKVSASTIFFESHPYRVNQETSMIDYDLLHKQAQEVKPQMIIAGFSAYPRDLEYKRFREICDDVNAYLFADICHVSGLVTAGLVSDPFEHADVVMTTTHKSLQGPRSAIIFSRNDKGLSKKIDEMVFPGLQGGAHNQKIAALATHLKRVASPEFKEYQKQILKNSRALAAELLNLG